MEIAVIDWKAIDSRFVKDDLYEHFKAPQWVDFFAPDAPVDDDAWFCIPECNHPKTVEDFYKVATPSSSSSKLQRSASVSDIPLGERNRRDATLKKRGQIQPSVSLNKDLKYDKIVEDSENQNPNFATPPRFKAKLMKQTIKSSTEKKPDDEKEEQIPKLRSTLSARNLFAGGDLLNKVSEFCNELKRLVVTRTKEREKCADENLETSPLMGENKQKEPIIVDDKERERKPLTEMTKETNELVAKSNTKEKQRRKLRNDNAENTPILVDVKNIKRRDEEILSQIRTNPPTPQCFSVSRGITKATPSKPLKSRPLETRGILQELERSSNEGKRKEDPRKMMSNNYQEGQRGDAIVAEKEATRALDVFWFLKPCTLAS
ncbi:uncharacterized protein LOC129884852 [Solanum dulcamara]|uniref:uncharacterized protein LOC129884852 n=1 Tax=Solanum dulcamara TaxID=45834 RepID=UPI0024859D1E|nr:uncharacterized protein LOC129884852 [Solanum dulcamara]